MRVAIVGATGNAGTALLRTLAEDERITEIVGIARRLPDVTAPPYHAARWELLDLATPPVGADGEQRIVHALSTALTGVDTVVHLAWLIQPNRNPDLTRRANVDGTRRLVQACRAAGVTHLVAASSVGAYSPAGDDQPRDESWPAAGISTSHYSVDKAAQERVLDEAEGAGMAVARLRPALVFDADAGAEITRLFLGALVPPRLLHPGALPVLPLPAGLRLQVVHGEDLADAYRRVIVQHATGAFNIATTSVLRGEDLADVLDHGRTLALPPPLLRRLVAIGWRSHAVAADPGWLDMAMNVPVMDVSRAERELGWQPRHGARETLREMLTAMAGGQGTASPPMRPRRRWPQDQSPPGASAPPATTGEHRVPTHLERDIFGLYLADHLAGATAGAERIERMARAYAGTDLGQPLHELAGQIREEREFLHDLIETLQLRIRPHRKAAAWLAERAGRAKLNHRPGPSPMTPLLELEIMRSAVAGKLAGWQTLAELAPDLGLPRSMFDLLVDRARDQAAALERLHQPVINRAFREGQAP